MPSMIPTIYVLATNVTCNRANSQPLALSKRTGNKVVPLFDILPHEHTDALKLASEMNRIRARKT